MLRTWRTVLALAAVVVLVAGCDPDDTVGASPDGEDGPDAAQDVIGTEDVAGDGVGGSDVAGDDLGDGGPTPDADEEVTAPEPLPESCDETRPCTGDQSCRSGVCVGDPPGGSVGHITDPRDNTATTDPPNLSCVGAPPTAPDGPETATLYGAVTRFGSGRRTFDVQVDVYRAEEWDPSACEAESDVEDMLGCYDSYGTPIASTTTIQPDASAEGTECDPANIHDDCPLGYECIGDEPTAKCELQFGLYQMEGIPTNTPLVVRSHFVGNELFASKWHDVYHFDVYVHADRVDADGNFRYDMTMVSEGQWSLTPNSVGLGDVAEANGVVGGRVRDCHVEGERPSWSVGEALLGLARPAERVVYFNDLETDTVPLQHRLVTNILGRFAALNVEPGWNVIAGSIRVGGEVVSLGSERVYVVPDALSIVSFPGQQPLWKQEPAGDFPQ
ncbi:MAG: hypothetical protein ACQEXJ_05160 [Myxococcota bacterium]